MLSVNITSGEKGSLYTLEIDNTQVDDSKGIGSYAATLSGVGLNAPLTVKLRKFNRSLGAVKLTSRVLGRIFRKHMDKLVTSPATPTPAAPKTRAKREPKASRTVSAPAPAPVTAASPEPAIASPHQI